jgi:hypothetical protein
MIDIILAAVVYGISALIVVWVAGALYFDVAQANVSGGVWITAWLVVVAAIFILSSSLSMFFLTLLAVCAGFLWWWFSIRPRQDRDWDPNFARPPRIELAGDQLTVHDVRNTEYRSIDDYDARFERRTYLLSQLQGVDVLILYWGSPWMSHPIFVFDFGTGSRLAISIEVRYRNGQRYSFWKSLYRQQELMYVVSDERDAILRRTLVMSGQLMYLYRVHGTPLEMRQFFFEYANRINQLAQSPQWYHGVTSNCTTGIYTQGRGRIRWSWRMLFNGRLDKLFYDRGRLDQSLPFDRLKSLSLVNEFANRAPSEGFGDYIRREMPGYGKDEDASPESAASNT